MATWKVQASDGQSWTIDAPEDVTEAEVNEFAAAHADSWEPGGRYRMEPSAPAKAPISARNLEAAAAVRSLDEQIKEKQAQVAGFKTPTETPGGAVVALTPSRSGQAKIGTLEDEIAELTRQREKLVIGSKGQTYGGVGGSLVGAGAGAVLGSPFGPPGVAIGGVLGSILGGAGGAALGTKLVDIPEAREALDISDEQAAALIRSRAIESVIWDGGFALLLGPGGRLLGKLANGQKFRPALTASVNESVAWDDVLRSKQDQLKAVSEKRGADVPKRSADQVSEALGQPQRASQAELTGELVRDLSQKTGGDIPTQGGMSGLASRSESFARRQSPQTFLVNEKKLTEAVEDIRRGALDTLDRSGAYGREELGRSLERVVDAANATLKETTGPVFQRAAEQNVRVNMSAAYNYMEDVLQKDAAAGRRLLTTAERNSLEASVEAMRQNRLNAGFDPSGTPIINMTAEAAQDFVSGNKAAARAVAADGTRPGGYMTKVLAEMNRLADESYLTAMRGVEDPALMKDLLGARALYRDTLGDLYSDALVKAARQDAEDVGRALTPKGAITEIRQLRKALDRAVENAPWQVTPGAQPSKQMARAEIEASRQRIDAGLIKGFVERNTQSLYDLGEKLRDAEFRDTLKELLMGEGMSNPALGRQILGELDKVVAAMRLIRPDLAAQPGKIASGVGSMGLGTITAAGAGNIQGGVGVAILTLGTARLIGHVMATSMTQGNVGALRALHRAMLLAPKVGQNAAAAEAFRGLVRELDAYSRETGGPGAGE